MDFVVSGGVDGFCVLCAFRDHFLLSLKSPGKTISPFKLVDNLNRILYFPKKYEFFSICVFV